MGERLIGHPSVPDDSPRHALWVMRCGSKGTRRGHKLGAARDGMASCRYCGAVMVDLDAYAYMRGADESVLGSFARWCPDSPE